MRGPADEGERAGHHRLTIPSRFCGPPGCGNGGWVAAHLARYVEGPAKARLFKPTPLEVPLAIEVSGDRVRLLDRDEILVECVHATLELDVPSPPTFGEAESATSRYVARDHHAFPNCFVCGTARAAGDGLRLFAGPLRGRDVVATPWIPDPSIANDRSIGDEFVWAALDCPGYFASCIDTEPKPAVLGEISAHVRGAVCVGERCIVIGWPLRRNGRKLTVATALFGESGAIVGMAKATWFEVELEASR